jgi:hypothetical protein
MTKKKDILAAISPDEAVVVLNELVKDPRIRKKAEEIALAGKFNRLAEKALADHKAGRTKEL